MAGGSQGDGDEGIVGINVTPLVDITLVLLIIFMVVGEDGRLSIGSARFAQGGVGNRRAGGLLARALCQRRYRRSIGSSSPTTTALLPLAREGHAKSADLRAVIKADGTVQHQRVIHVLDLLKQAGISKIAFGVTPVAPEPGGTAAPAVSR